MEFIFGIQSNKKEEYYQKMKYFVLKLLKGYKFSHKIKTKELKNYQIHKNNDTNKFEYYPTTNNINMQEKSKKKRYTSYYEFSNYDVIYLKNFLLFINFLMLI
jgi:hypothetical protein